MPSMSCCTKSSGMARVVSGGLIVDRREENCKKCRDRRRLPNVEIGVEVHLPVVVFGEEIDPRLAFGNGELAAIECRRSVRESAPASWSSGPAPASFLHAPSPGSARARARSIGGSCVRRTSYRSLIGFKWAMLRASSQTSLDVDKEQEKHADTQRECEMGGRSEGWSRVVQRADGTRRSVQFQLALRERRRVEPRRVARRGRSGVLQHGVECVRSRRMERRRRRSRRRPSARSKRSATAFSITKMQLDVRAKVAKVDDATFQRIARETKEGCPVSKALKGNVDLQVTATLT